MILLNSLINYNNFCLTIFGVFSMWKIMLSISNDNLEAFYFFFCLIVNTHHSMSAAVNGIFASHYNYGKKRGKGKLALSPIILFFYVTVSSWREIEWSDNITAIWQTVDKAGGRYKGDHNIFLYDHFVTILIFHNKSKIKGK